ncbi:MAG: VWA domain-containing protein [Candidatus Acidiferrales bacterium]
MTQRRVALLVFLLLLFLVAGSFGGRLIGSFGVALAHQAPQDPPQQPSSQAAAPPIKAESRAVRVDVVVTDKKGNYVHDLKADDFKVYEDNKQQPVTNFSFGADPNAAAASGRHYLVLFFDNSTMDVGDQAQARTAAAKFIDQNAGPDRVMAVMDFGGTLRVEQNFTADAARLKQAVQNIETSAVDPNGTASGASSSGGLSLPGSPSTDAAAADFGVQTLLLAVRSVAKSLASVPGRKSMILFSSGFPLSPEAESELTATIDVCNKANVAIYPLDVRGLVTPDIAPGSGHHVSPPSYLAYLPHGGGGGGGGGGLGGGGGGGTGGTGGKGGSGGTGGTGGGGSRGGVNNTGTYGNPNNTQPRAIVPAFPPSAATNQQVLYMLADGTGGFPIFDTNDLFAGLQKIANEQNEYYLLGYVPTDSSEGSCHTLKVKVERGGANVRARSGYCNIKASDMLAGKPIEKELETRAAASGAATEGSLEAPFFYTSINEARVDLAMEVPSATIDFSKVKGKYHADVNVLGIAYRPDGSVAARFSDEINMDFEKEELQKFTQSPMRYQTQFSVAPGQYRLTVVLSGGAQKFGKYETSLAIEPYDGKTFSLSGLAFSNEMQRVSAGSSDLDADLLADRMPMIVQGVELTPSGSNHFKKTDRVVLYAQIYDPSLSDPNPPLVGCRYVIIDQKTGKQVLSTGLFSVTPYVLKGNPVVPLALKVPVDTFPPGEYRLEMQSGDAGGAISHVRIATFQTE